MSTNRIRYSKQKCKIFKISNDEITPRNQSNTHLIYTTNLIICGDINIDYLKTSNYKFQLDCLLASYNLSSLVDFPTRITGNTSTAIDNIFIDRIKNNDYTAEPMINGLSDHDAQILVLYNINVSNQETSFARRQIINSDTIAQFKVNAKS